MTPTTRPSRGTRRTRRTLVAAALATALAACTGAPEPTPSPSAGGEGSPTPDELDAAERELAANVAAIGATLEGLRSALDDAADGDADALERAGRLLAADLAVVRDVAAARTAAATAQQEQAAPGVDEQAGDDPGADVTDATDDGDGRGATADPGRLAPLLPGPLVSRATTVSYGDLLTSTLAAARGAGSAGRPVLRFLAAPTAGDLGAWQRGPADLLVLVAEAGTTNDIDRAAEAILALEGDAPRALAWVVHGLTTRTDVAEAAARASAHLAVIELAYEDLR